MYLYKNYNKMQKVLNKQNRQNKQNKQTKTDKEEQKKIPESVIFHPYHIRQIDRSGIVKALKLKAKKLKYRIK